MTTENQALLPGPAWLHQDLSMPTAGLLKLLQESEDRYRSLVEISADAVLVHCEGAFVLVNDAAVQMLGAGTPDHLIGRAIADFVPPADCQLSQLSPQPVVAPSITEPAERVIEERRAGFVRRKLLRIDGSDFEASVKAHHCRHEGKPAIQLVARTESQAGFNDASRAGGFDALTRMPNRGELRDRLIGSLARAQRNAQSVALLFIDLDDFQQVNASLGQENADMVLRTLAQRLKQRARRSDTVGRLGGDAFAIILEGLADARGAAVVATRLLDVLSRPVLICGQPIQVSASIGISVYPSDAEDLERIWRNADLALFGARSRGGDNFQFHTAELEELRRRGVPRRSDTPVVPPCAAAWNT